MPPLFHPHCLLPKILVSSLLLASCGLFGCASYAKRVGQIRESYYLGNLAAADNATTEALKKEKTGADILKLDSAMISLAGGRPDLAEKTLREVRDHFDYLEGPNATEAALSYLSDDNRRAYAGEDYEKVLIRALLALSNLMHDGGDAEAYSLQMIEKQEQIITSGLDAKKEENPKANYQRVALAPYLRGVLRESTHRDYHDAERSFVTVVNWQPDFQSGKLDVARVTQGHHSAQGNGVLYVFALTGRGPYKQEVAEVPSSASLLIAGEIVSAVGKQTVPPNVAAVKVPRIAAHVNGTQAVAVEVGGKQVGVTETITDVTQLAIAQHQAIYHQIVARAVARRVLKKAAVYGTKEATGTNKGSLGSLAFDLAGVAWEASESADTRCWGLLPDRIQVLRIELPAGEHTVGLNPLGPQGEITAPAALQRVTIGDARNTYVLANFPDNHLVGQILVSQP